jgi:hypothetical protein
MEKNVAGIGRGENGFLGDNVKGDLMEIRGWK